MSQNLPRILLIEDNPDVHPLVVRALKGVREVRCVTTLAEGREALGRETFGLILLDVDLADGNGFEFFANLRSSPDYAGVPVVFLTAHGRPTEKVTGFALGAEDYVVKPFEPTEFKARVEARLRGGGEGRLATTRYDFEGLRIDVDRHTVHTDENGTAREVSLTRIELRILVALARNAERVLTRDRLIELALGTDSESSDRAIDKHVCHLRRKLGARGVYLKTVPGSGYMLSTRNPASRRAA